MYTTFFCVGFSDFVCRQKFLENDTMFMEERGKTNMMRYDDEKSSGFMWMWPKFGDP